MKNKIGHIISCTAFALYAIAVCMLCFVDMSNGPEINLEWFGISADKVAHFLMFIPFPILMTLVFGKFTWRTDKFLIFITITVIIGIVAGGIIELLQGITDYRNCDINDFRADCLGVATGAIITAIIRTLLKTGKKEP